MEIVLSINYHYYFTLEHMQKKGILESCVLFHYHNLVLLLALLFYILDLSEKKNDQN